MAKKNLPYPAEKIGELLIEVDNEVAKKSDLNDFVKKESGRGLSTNDYTTAEKTKLAGIQGGAQKNTVTSVRGALQLNPQVGNVVISAADIGLGDANTRLTSLEDNVSAQSEEVAAVGAKVNTLQGTDAGKSVRTIAAEETAKIVGNAPANYDTLKEIADYIASDATGAAELNNKVNKNTTDIAKLAKDLDETHQLASNAESAISEVVELTIPAIESDVANKATKSEAQGYANTAESNANAYTNAAMSSLISTLHINVGEVVKLTFTSLSNDATISSIISFSGRLGSAKDLLFYATYAQGNVAQTKYRFIQQSGNISIYIDPTQGVPTLYIHSISIGGTISVENLNPANVVMSTVTEIPSGVTQMDDANTVATLTDVRDKLGKTEQAADSAKLGGVAAANYIQKSGGTFTGNVGIGDNNPKEKLSIKGDASVLVSLNSPSDEVGIRFQRGGVGVGFVGYNINYGTYLFTHDGSHRLSLRNGIAYVNSQKVITEGGGTFTGNITAPKLIGPLQGKADSATKLATARTIWGQSFDGSGDVNGDATITGKLNVGSYIVSTISGGDNVCQISNNAATAEIRITNAGSARLMRWKDGAGKNIIESDGIKTTLQTGNIGIGTTNPSEKLDVAGNIKASGNVYAKGLQIDGDVVITGNVTIQGRLESSASYQITPLATTGEDGEVPSVEQQLRSQISSLEERIATLEQLIAQNNG